MPLMGVWVILDAAWEAAVTLEQPKTQAVYPPIPLLAGGLPALQEVCVGNLYRLCVMPLSELYLCNTNYITNNILLDKNNLLALKYMKLIKHWPSLKKNWSVVKLKLSPELERP